MTQLTTAASRWLRRPLPRPAARVSLVCFPHAGGSAAFYTPWARLLPPDVQLVAVQYPGRQDRLGEPPAETMDELAEAVAKVLRTDGADGHELILFGHSMGASVAWETALRLEAGAGPAPRHVFVSGRPGPRHQRPGQVHLRDDDGLAAELRRLDGTHTELLDDPEIRAVLLPAVRADYRLIETYRPDTTARLRCPLGAFTGDADEEAPVDDVATWRTATAGAFTQRVLPGGHFYLVPQAEGLVAAVLDACGSSPGRSVHPVLP
ncbi:thioesterase II family protein [Streptomyces albicerus]|uniref:thioesterase II family protein n=1 Tax=Streptomyces albicerus TaxID=2569859 RepID=UPI00124AFA03|nr:alpha/beta fold hydrolase [Streptomyces albicerus]